MSAATREGGSSLPAVGRLAPTPSGLLHLGNARSFLLAWLWARSAGGRVILRIEDVDLPRCRPEFLGEILRDLEWLGIDWDERAADQSTRFPDYRAALERLAAAGLAYPCACSRRDVEEASSAPHGEEGPVYPGTCRERRAPVRGSAWRFRFDGAPIAFRDEVVGEVAIDPATLGDFVVWRREELPSYQLAVAVDDAAGGVTQVLRGRDLLTSTARQLALYRALGLRAPVEWAHAPFLRDAVGGRMAKRDAAIALGTLRDEGVDPRRLIAFLAKTAGLVTDDEPRTARDLIATFAVQSLPREDATVPTPLPFWGS